MVHVRLTGSRGTVKTRYAHTENDFRRGLFPCLGLWTRRSHIYKGPQSCPIARIIIITIYIYVSVWLLFKCVFSLSLSDIFSLRIILKVRRRDRHAKNPWLRVSRVFYSRNTTLHGGIVVRTATVYRYYNKRDHLVVPFGPSTVKKPLQTSHNKAPKVIIYIYNT